MDERGNARAAETHGLRHVRDDRPGIRRRRCGKGLMYIEPDGEVIREKSVKGHMKGRACEPRSSKLQTER